MQWPATITNRFAVKEGKLAPLVRDQRRSLRMEDQFDVAGTLSVRLSALTAAQGEKESEIWLGDQGVR